jgi:hypothetical protein
MTEAGVSPAYLCTFKELSRTLPINVDLLELNFATLTSGLLPYQDSTCMAYYTTLTLHGIRRVSNKAAWYRSKYRALKHIPCLC